MAGTVAGRDVRRRTNRFGGRKSTGRTLFRKMGLALQRRYSHAEGEAARGEAATLGIFPAHAPHVSPWFLMRRSQWAIITRINGRVVTETVTKAGAEGDK